MFEKFWKAALRRPGFSLWLIPRGIFRLVSLCYSAGARIHRAWPRSKAKVGIPVVSVGNISVGGSGKTPLVVAIAEAFGHLGFRVGIAARGYGRSGNESVVGSGSELLKLGAESVGDEVILMAEKLPQATFAVHAVKAEAAKKLAGHYSLDLIIVDDGFQHFRLHRDLDIVAFDASIPNRNLHPLPYGVLREALSTLKLADLVVVTRPDLAGRPGEIASLLDTHAPSAPRFEARYSITTVVGIQQSHSVEYLKDKRVLLFAGIGNFEALKIQVERLSGTLAAAIELSDHQMYDSVTVQRLRDAVAEASSQVVLTTAKDWVKVRDFDFGPEFYYLNLQLEFVPPLTELTSCIIDRLGLKQRTK